MYEKEANDGNSDRFKKKDVIQKCLNFCETMNNEQIVLIVFGYPLFTQLNRTEICSFFFFY